MAPHAYIGALRYLRHFAASQYTSQDRPCAVRTSGVCLWQIVSQLPPHIVVARSVLVLLRDFGEALPCVPQPILLYLCQVGPRARARPPACHARFTRENHEVTALTRGGSQALSTPSCASFAADALAALSKGASCGAVASALGVLVDVYNVRSRRRTLTARRR